MAVAFLGDLSFTQLLSSEVFRSRMRVSHSVYQVTNLETLSSYRVLLPGEAQYLVVGCLPSLVSGLQCAKDESRESAIKRMMTHFGSALTGILTSHPTVRVMVIRPLLRTRPLIYSGDLVMLQPHLASLDAGSSKIRVMPHFPMDSAMLHNDGCTLTDEAAVTFLDFLYQQVVELITYFENQELLESSFVNLSGASGAALMAQSTPHQSMSSSFLPPGYSTPVVPEAIKSGPCFRGTSSGVRLLDPATATTATICTALNSFYGEFSDLCIQSNFDYAHQMDVNDAETNTKSTCKVVVSGLLGSTYPGDLTGQKNIFKQVLGPIVTMILGPDIDFDVYPRRGMLRGSTLPPVEVDLKTTALATRFKAEGARLSRAKQNGLGSVYFNPCITLSTRVRVEILRAVAGRVTCTNVLAYCVSNGPRPKLSVGPSVGYAGRRASLPFVEAIKKYGYLLEERFLEKAYDRAQLFFTGDMERLFLVLRESVALARAQSRGQSLPGPSQGVPNALDQNQNQVPAAVQVQAPVSVHVPAKIQQPEFDGSFEAAPTRSASLAPAPGPSGASNDDRERKRSSDKKKSKSEHRGSKRDASASEDYSKASKKR